MTTGIELTKRERAVTTFGIDLTKGKSCDYWY